MPVLPTELYRAAEVRELDRRLMRRPGIDGLALMRRAGQAAFRALGTHWPRARRISVVCGAGNNGGDGYVVARLAREAGFEVQIVTSGGEPKGDAAAAASEALDAGLEPVPGPRKISGADVIVDALLGTGLNRPVEGEALHLIHAMNACGAPVLAIDLPSGLNADTGAVMGAVVQADVTVTFVGLKAGLFTGEGRAAAGQILFADLGATADLYAAMPPVAQRMDAALLASLLPPRPRSAHKGHYGHVLVVGGDFGFSGAARMAAEAAARTGAGLVTVVTRPEHALQIPAARPEIMARGVDTPADLAPLLERATVAAVGPGLGQSAWSRALLARMLETRLPMVLDADALNLIAIEPARVEGAVLTPHPGEASRLLGQSTKDVQRDRIAAARALRQRYGGVVVLKGSGTVVADGDDHIHICSDGNPGMASGGMGDVLTGTIAGLLAQHYSAGDAARLGVCLHAAAGDRAAAEGGERGLLATDLLPWIRALANPAS